MKLIFKTNKFQSRFHHKQSGKTKPAFQLSQVAPQGPPTPEHHSASLVNKLHMHEKLSIFPQVPLNMHRLDQGVVLATASSEQCDRPTGPIKKSIS
jgi:hypothetical protein